MVRINCCILDGNRRLMRIDEQFCEDSIFLKRLRKLNDMNGWISQEKQREKKEKKDK